MPTDRPVKGSAEIRARVISFRSKTDDSGKKMLVGMPIVYDSDSEDLGWYTESIVRGAATKALLRSDPRALYGHNSNTLLPLGRMSAKTLREIETDKGVEIEIDLPDTQFARDLVLSIDRGDIQDMSFGFSVSQDTWSVKDGKDHRTIIEIGELFDYSFVVFPAYPDTTAATRSLKIHRESSGHEDISPDIEDENLDIDLLTFRLGDI